MHILFPFFAVDYNKRAADACLHQKEERKLCLLDSVWLVLCSSPFAYQYQTRRRGMVCKHALHPRSIHCCIAFSFHLLLPRPFRSFVLSSRVSKTGRHARLNHRRVGFMSACLEFFFPWRHLRFFFSPSPRNFFSLSVPRRRRKGKQKKSDRSPPDCFPFDRDVCFLSRLLSVCVCVTHPLSSLFGFVTCVSSIEKNGQESPALSSTTSKREYAP
jgi:hypothetical protein